MPVHSSGYVHNMTLRLGDDPLTPQTIVGDSELDRGGFFFSVLDGKCHIQISGTPEQLAALGREMQNAAADMATRLAANRDARDERNTAAMNGWRDLPGLATQ